MATSKGQAFLQQQVEFLTRGDMDGLMREQYHDDAEMVTFEFTLKGKAAIRKYLEFDEPAKAGKIGGIELRNFAESDDVIIFNAAVKSENLGTFIARDALYLRDGKIYRHIALTLPPGVDPLPEPKSG
jgi:hypothetical protein